MNKQTQDTITPHPDYVKGFNEGYILSQGAPKLFEQLSKIENVTERISGLKDGGRQYLLEKARETSRSWTSERSSPDAPDPDKDKTADRDREPER